MILLEEYNLLEDYSIIESTDRGEKKFFLRGVFSRVDYANKNKRIYPRSVMEESINSARDAIKHRGFVGQLDHPNSIKIDVGGISHVITELAIAPDGAVLGEAEALNTIPGKHLQELMKSRIRLGVSTRGAGTVKPYNGPLGEGLVEVNPGYQMRAVDIVFDPSATAYPEYVNEETENKIIIGSTIKFRQVWEEVFG